VQPEGESSKTNAAEARYHSPTTDKSALVPDYSQSALSSHAGTLAQQTRMLCMPQQHITYTFSQTNYLKQNNKETSAILVTDLTRETLTVHLIIFVELIHI